MIVLSEMPGINPHVARFARWVRRAGFTVYLPSLFGRDGRGCRRWRKGLAVIRRACVSRGVHALAGRGSGPVTAWLRALARLAHAECGDPGVGAIGMCFTGNFALAMMLEPAMLAQCWHSRRCPLDDPAAVEAAPRNSRRCARDSSATI